MKKRLLALTFAGALFAGAAAYGADFSVGIRIGPPPAPRAVAVRPVSPGSGYVWVDGYWYPDGRHYRWHDGYWTRPPYAGARWVGPHHDGQLFYNGYWEGDRGRFGHDHRWDRDHDRRDNDRDRDHDRH